MKTISKKFLIGAVLTVVTLLGAWGHHAEALTTVSFSPSSTTVNPGEQFDVNVLLTSESQFGAVDLELQFRPDVLNVVSFTPSVAYSTSTSDGTVIDNAQGRITRTVRLLGSTATTTVLGKVRFVAHTSGMSTIVALASSTVGMPNSSQNDSINNSAVFTAFVTGSMGIGSYNVFGGTVAGVQTTQTYVEPSRAAVAKTKISTVKTKTSGTMVLQTPQGDLSLDTGEEALGTTSIDNTNEVSTTSDIVSTSEVAGASTSRGISGKWIGIGIGVLALLILIGLVSAMSRTV
ncbi:MAG TPA: cohesin domain-containing protein [Candidatus Paceibacterota bacterium]